MSDLPDLDIVDPHHHLWDLQTNRYPWLSERRETRVCGDYDAICVNYLLPDLLRDAQGLRLKKTVHVQAEHDHADPVRETRWLQSIADGDASGIPHGIVAYADLTAPNAAEILAQHAQSPNVRGIRQMLHEGLVDPANPQPTPLDNPTFREGIRLLPRHNFSFDLQIYPAQAAAAFELVHRTPGVAFILTHTGLPAGQSREGLAAWFRAMQQLAQLDNLAVKISGFGMFDRGWTPDTIRPFVLATIDLFGANRAMFASNFPVDSMASSYTRLWSAYSEITAHYSVSERQAMFGKNAERIYRLR